MNLSSEYLGGLGGICLTWAGQRSRLLRFDRCRDLKCGSIKIRLDRFFDSIRRRI